MFSSARSYTFLSIGAAAATIVLKLAAWRITGSVGLLSDALESGVNLVAALAAFWALTQAAKPADREHPYGHFNAEYFSSGLESALILVAAAAILVAAAQRLMAPEPLEQLGAGLGLSLVASAINGLVALLLLGAVAASTPSPCGPMPSTCSPTCAPRWGWSSPWGWCSSPARPSSIR